MKVAMVMPFYSPGVRNPDDVLERYPIVRLLPAELAKRGHAVTVLLHAEGNSLRERDGVRYEFIRPGRLAVVAGNAIHRRKPRYGPAYYQPATRLVRRLDAFKPHVVHFFGLTMDLQLALVVRRARRLRVPVVVHFHGGMPAMSGRLRMLQRHNIKRSAMVLFTTKQQSEMWLAGGVGLGPGQVAHVLETSSPFQKLDREVARARTGMSGNPVYLSTGRLHLVKDPLTMLRGFARMREQQPQARLYLYYLTDEMLPEMRTFLESRPALCDAVELRGRALLREMEAVYSSGDFLLQASEREWSGLAVLEAMSCGCIPIVSDIPAFAMMTADGRYGRLFQPGDAEGLAAAALAIAPEERGVLSDEVLRHFEERLSFRALACDVERVYLEVSGSQPD